MRGYLRDPGRLGFLPADCNIALPQISQVFANEGKCPNGIINTYDVEVRHTRTALLKSDYFYRYKDKIKYYAT